MGCQCITRISRIKPIHIFPIIGNTVTVAVELIPHLQFGCRIFHIAADIFGGIDQAACTAIGTFIPRNITISPRTYIVRHTFVDRIATEAATAVTKHLFISNLCGMGGCGSHNKFPIGNIIVLRSIFAFDYMESLIIIFITCLSILLCLRTQIGTGIVETVPAQIENPMLKKRVIDTCLSDAPGNRRLFVGRRTGFIIVVDEIITSATATITTQHRPPIIDNIVTHIYKTFLGKLIIPNKPRCTAVMVRQQVMMVRGFVTAPKSAIPVSTFHVRRGGKALGNITPLHRKILYTVKRSGLVDAPRKRAMVDNNIFLIPCPSRIGLSPRIIAQAAADITHDHIIGFDVKTIVTKAYPVSGRRLSRNSKVSVIDNKVAFKFNGSGHIEHNRTGAFLVDRITKRPGIFRIVFERRNVIYFTSATARYITPATFGSRESQQFVLSSTGNGHAQQQSHVCGMQERFQFDSIHGNFILK